MPRTAVATGPESLPPSGDGRAFPGLHRAVPWGAVLIAFGLYATAVPAAAVTWAGLGLVGASTGLLTPHVATVTGFPLRWATSIGAVAGPVVTGRHRGRYRGLSAPAIGMTFGLVQYVTCRRHLAGRKRATEFALPSRAIRRAVRLVTTGPAPAAALAVPFAAAHALPGGLIVGLRTLVSIATGVALGGLPFLLMAHSFRPARSGTDGAITVAPGLAEPVAGPRPRRTTLPVH
ncbi:hypothetical protein ACIHCM_30765 [Streptomyces sp. NPDC052023]|uniref:hypothetical protein n=1 Tax=Streptomyces sp. NPDC052023 TaxID=3365681 RepID=UPI0037D84441